MSARDDVTQAWASLCVLHGVLDELQDQGWIQESPDALKSFPKGGMFLVKAKALKAFRAVESALAKLEKTDEDATKSHPVG